VSALPCIGFGITVVDPGPSPDVINAKVFGRRRARRSGGAWKKPAWHRALDRPFRLLRAYVIANDGVQWHMDRGVRICWKSGIRTGEVWEKDEMATWTRGHGPEARAAFLAVRALTGVK
jgi:hypothetical protein